MTEVYTPRLRLRPPHPEDGSRLASMMCPGISARLASWPASLAPASARLRVQQSISALEAGLALPLVITRLSDGELVGWIGASRTESEPRRALLTYWIGEAFHGQGIMREAAPAALEAIFRMLGVTEVRAAVQNDNLASRAVLRGLGMRAIGHGRIWCSARGREEACEWWGITRAEQPSTAPSMAFVQASRSAEGLAAF